MEPLIGGTTIAHDVFALDYCFRANLESLLALCDEVVVMDAGGSDGTSQYLSEMLAKHSRLRVFNCGWGAAQGGGRGWLGEMAAKAKGLLRTKYHIHLQADEVLHERDFDSIRRMAETGVGHYGTRHNFYPDLWHTTSTAGREVMRFAPTHYHFTDDAGSLLHPDRSHGETHPDDKPTDVCIYHYGFVRHPSKLLEKYRQLSLEMGTPRGRLDALSAGTLESIRHLMHPEDQLPFNGTHPQFVSEWINEHPYLL